MTVPCNGDHLIFQGTKHVISKFQILALSPKIAKIRNLRRSQTFSPRSPFELFSNNLKSGITGNRGGVNPFSSHVLFYLFFSFNHPPFSLSLKCLGQSDQNHGVVKCSLNPTVIVLFTCKTETLSYYSLIVLYRFNIDENWRIINLCVYHKSGFGYKSWRFSTKSVLWENEVYGRETFVMFRQNVILNRSWKRSKIFTKSRDIANLIKKIKALCYVPWKAASEPMKWLPQIDFYKRFESFSFAYIHDV